MTDAIAAWKADPDTQANPDVNQYMLAYTGGGSGGAQAAMTLATPTQSIGPMSRNYTAGALGDPVFGIPPFKNVPAPGIPNVVGLDAGVLVEKGTLSNPCPNLTIVEDPNDPGKAVVDNPLALILGGKSYLPPQCSLSHRSCQLYGTVWTWFNDHVSWAPDCEAPSAAFPNGEGSCIQGAEGTVEACKDPARIQALTDFQACFGPAFATIQHFYRMDDNSGTTDTFRERLRIKRFCNGLGHPPSVTPRSSTTTPARAREAPMLGPVATATPSASAAALAIAGGRRTSTRSGSPASLLTRPTRRPSARTT